MTPARWALALACAIAFWFRAIAPFYRVFQPGFINFQETDAWFHVRIMEHLVRNFPFRLGVDPYGSILDGQRVDTGPFYDWIPALLSLPFPHHLQTVAAWYPALLGVLIIVAVFLLARQLFGEFPAALAALVAATLPGSFLVITSLGFTDHHVMESLLSVLIIFFLVRRQPIPAGLALAAYLLTFVGGAFLVAIVTAWAIYGFLRFPADANYTLNLVPVFAIPLPFVLLYVGHVIWMEFSAAALVAGLAATTGAQFCRRLQHPRAYWLTAVAGAAALAVALFPHALGILQYLAPNRSGAASSILELQSLLFAKGYFSLEWAWLEFGGVYLLAILAILLLAVAAIRTRNAPSALFALWAIASFSLSVLQARMIYYFAPAAAVLAGYLIHRAWQTKPALALAAGLLAFAPNIWSLVLNPPLPTVSVPAPWRDALDWLRTNTPEPFNDPNAYTANGVSPQSAQYGVLSWWDFGYWISAIGRRVPLTNPTQKNASIAATFFLAQTEEEALQIMTQWRLRYVLMDQRLADSFFTAYFHFLPNQRRQDYILEGVERLPDGTQRHRRFYTPAYYKTMAARLAAGGQAVPATGPFTVVVFSQPAAAFTHIRSFPNGEDAARFQAACAREGCQLVGEQPAASIVPVEPLTRLKQVYPARPGPTSVAIFDRN